MHSVIANIERILNLCDVDTSSWGIGQAKSIQDLMVEISAKESYLRINSRGIARVLEVVRIEIRDPELGLLIEESQVLPDGRARKRGGVPSGKIRSGEETAHAAGYREIEEELGLKQGTYICGHHQNTTEVRNSSSYPGLQTEYHLTTLYITLNSEVLNLLKPGAHTIEADGTQHFFVWKKE
jgi:8-oxo-dGTP pyrophosphatase MutT (NUDIX family)